MKIRNIAQQVEDSAGDDSPKSHLLQEDFLSTGCTLLNLAISDLHNGGFMKGKYYFLVGDSTSGKTFFSMTCFAEAVRNKQFEDYRLIYDNVEDGMLMDVRRLFGEAVEDRIEPPSEDNDGNPVHSETIEQFYYHVDDALNGKPFIYVLDSMDGLDSDADRKKFTEKKKAHEKGTKDTAGSYGMAKAKANSTGLRQVVGRLRESGSILIIISQTRDNVDTFSFEKKTRSGGHALKFYATVEIWTSLAGQLKKTVRAKSRPIGNKIKIKIKKNRVTGKIQEVVTAIYPSYGVDDIGSNVDFLLEEGWWKKRKQTILATEFDVEATREKLIKFVEGSPKKERRLRKIVERCWKEIEEGKDLGRPGRYS